MGGPGKAEDKAADKAATAMSAAGDTSHRANTLKASRKTSKTSRPPR